ELNSGAAFSPDGRHLAHFRANGARLVIRELTTGLEREIPFGAQLGSGSAAVDWCSSDTLIAAGYVGDYVAYRVNLKDASVQRLPIKPIPYPSPLCVGDGEEIIYIPLTPTNARDSIVRRSLASGKETTLFNGEVTALARSIDGERLAVVAVDSNTNVARLVTMSAAGGDISADLMTSSSLRPRGARRSYPLLEDVAWMPSGDRLLVVRGDEEALTKPVDTQTQPMPMQTPTWLWEVPLSGAAPRNLGLLPLPKVVGTFLGARSFTVQPGGKLLAFQSHEGFVEQTWAIDNLMQFIKAGGGW
ncbi:MAG: hypothetical protein ACRD2A_06965, partial [Vicinamibacterales bacterium]